MTWVNHVSPLYIYIISPLPDGLHLCGMRSSVFKKSISSLQWFMPHVKSVVILGFLRSGLFLS